MKINVSVQKKIVLELDKTKYKLTEKEAIDLHNQLAAELDLDI